MPIELPEPQLAALQDHAARLFDSRKSGTDLRSLARDLLHALFDVCTYAGLDKVLVELAAAFPPADPADRAGLADHDVACAALVGRLEAIDLDGRGPRNAKPRQLAESVVAALELTVVPATEPRTTLGGDVRAAVASALASVLDVALAVPAIRDAVVADARARCDESLQSVFAKIAAQLDERGMQLMKQPKVPLDAMQAVQRALAEARAAVIGRAASEAIDRAKAVIAASDADAAARIDLPVTLRLTPRDVAILRACDVHLFKTPVNVVQVILASLGDLARIAWRAPEQVVHPYSATRTFAVGDVIDHPKFGRGSVVSRLAQRIDVEFADGKHTLVHVAPRS
jgi:hypothetical protein